MSHFHSKLFIILIGLLSCAYSITAQASISVAITLPVPALRIAVNPPEGYQGCYQIPAGFYDGTWTDGYQMCFYRNTPHIGMWVSPHWECDDYFAGSCRSWSWVDAYWNQDWDNEWSSRWVWISPFWDWRWDPHFDRRWDRHWHGQWNRDWRGHWNPDWRAHRDRHWHGDKHFSSKWDGRKEPHREMRQSEYWREHDDSRTIRSFKRESTTQQQEEPRRERLRDWHQQQDNSVRINLNNSKSNKDLLQDNGRNTQERMKLFMPNNFKQAPEKEKKLERYRNKNGNNEQSDSRFHSNSLNQRNSNEMHDKGMHGNEQK